MTSNTGRFERFSLAIFEISRYWHKLTAEEMEVYGLKGVHSVYLLAMDRRPDGITAQQLVELCGRDKADVSRMMSIMGEKGLVTKEGAHQNRYGGVFKLTPIGSEAAEHVRLRANLAVELAGQGLTEEYRAIFYEALESVAAKLRDLSKNGLPTEKETNV